MCGLLFPFMACVPIIEKKRWKVKEVFYITGIFPLFFRKN